MEFNVLFIRFIKPIDSKKEVKDTSSDRIGNEYSLKIKL